MNGKKYTDIVVETIQKAYDSQAETILSVARLMADTIESKRNIFVFGCSHAGILAQEVFYRTGGLAVINPIFFSGFSLDTKPITMTSALERISGLGITILKQNHVQKGDLLIIHSVSGRNHVPVEMATEAKKMGINTVCLTNLDYSRNVTSRHPSGKRLFEVCDIVIDNCGEVGDAAISLQGLPEKIGPTSTAVGVALINAIIIEAVENLIERGIVPPVFMSANLDGGDAHNERIFAEYKENIFYQ